MPRQAISNYKQKLYTIIVISPFLIKNRDNMIIIQDNLLHFDTLTLKMIQIMEECALNVCIDVINN